MGHGSLSPSYSSGRDFAVEVEGVRFGFSSADFASRVGAAALRLGLVTEPALGDRERRDLVALAAQGRIVRAQSALAAHLAAHRAEMTAGGEDPVHWLRRLVFRGAWIDQQVADGALTPVFCDGVGFRYRSAPTGEPAAEEPAMPDWSHLTYRGGS